MRNIREKVRAGLALVVLAVTAACSSDSPVPTGIEAPAPSFAKLSATTGTIGLDTTSTQTLSTVQLLGRTAPLASDITASAVVGEMGGTIQIPAAGFRLYIPPGALSKSTKISVTALAGSGVAYHFEPHGISFNIPIFFTQDSKFTQNPAGLLLKGAYFKSDTQVDNKGKKAVVDETYQVNLDALGMILFGIKHFSGYLVSCA